MAEVASAYVTLIPSAKGFASGIQGQLGGQLTRAGKQGGTDFGTGMKSGVAGIATKVFAPLAIAAAGLGLGKILSDSITAGSDFQQATGAVEAIFKKQADSVKNDSEKAALALGLSKNAYLELATVTGASLKNKGIKDFAAQAKDLIGVGADLAATFGGSTKEAVEALNSLLRGETDPIEKYGIAINAAAIEGEAVSLGLLKRVKDADKIKAAQNTATLAQKRYNDAVKEHGKDSDQAKRAETSKIRSQAALSKALAGQKVKLSDTAKATAALSLVQKQSGDSAGAFAKESDTYAGSQQRLSASWEDIKTQVGAKLLPALTDLSQWFLKEGLPALKKFGDWVKDKLWPALKDGWETVRPGLEKAQKILMDAFGGDSSTAVKDFATFVTDKLIPGIAEFVNVWLPIMATQMAGTVEAIQAIYDVFKTVLEIQARVASAIMGAFIAVTDAAVTMLDALSNVPGFGWAKTAADKLRDASTAAKGVKDAIDNIPDSKTVKVSLTVDENYTAKNKSRFSISGNGYAPGRATGGPVKAGHPYMVGEKGPELIVPRYHGNVIPNHDLGSGFGLSGGGDRIDYARLGDEVAHSMGKATFAVGVAPVTQAINQRNATRARY